MTLTERDELLIQKCVDEELSSHETRDLLLRLDALNCGWKVLACGLLEDRLLRRTLSPREGSAQTVVDAENLSPSVTSAKPGYDVRWAWSHPLTSLALCAAIAFVAGKLAPDLSSKKAEVSPMDYRGDLSAAYAVPQASPAEAGTVTLPFDMDGRPVEVPVFSRIPDLRRADRDHPLFVGEAVDRSRHTDWILVPLGQSRSMLIPVSDDSSLDVQ